MTTNRKRLNMDDPTRFEIEQHALMQGATREEIADLEDECLMEKYGDPRDHE